MTDAHILQLAEQRAGILDAAGEWTLEVTGIEDEIMAMPASTPTGIATKLEIAGDYAAMDFHVDEEPLADWRDPILSDLWRMLLGISPEDGPPSPKRPTLRVIQGGKQ